MKLLEKFIKGKAFDENLCEDGFYFSEDFVVVVDGATSKSKRNFDGKSSGKVATEIALESVKKFKFDICARQAVDIITNEIAIFYKKRGVFEEFDKNQLERASASIVIYSCHRKEIWMVGDCQALVDSEQISNNKKIDDILANARACFVEALLANGDSVEDLLKNDLGRKFISPMLEKQSIFQNNNKNLEYSYWVIDGFEVLDEGIKIIPVPVAKNIVLATDGYPKIFNNLEETEEYLRQMIEKDPLCCNLNKGTKGVDFGNCSYDDRVYLSFEG